jgi:hypothetical protein
VSFSKRFSSFSILRFFFFIAHQFPRIEKLVASSITNPHHHRSCSLRAPSILLQFFFNCFKKPGPPPQKLKLIMADFVALTPPLSQQPWAAIPVLVYAAGVNTPGNFVEVNPILLGFGAGVTLEDFGYPPLSAPFRVRILKKYPGTIFPDPRLQDGEQPHSSFSPFSPLPPLLLQGSIAFL